MNIVLMTTQGYGHKFTANNSKSEFIALGLMEQGCKVTIFNSATGEKNCNEVQERISSNGIHYYDFKYVNNRFWKNYQIIKDKLIELKQEDDVNHIIIGMTLFPIFVKLSYIAKEVGYTRSTLFHEWHIGCKQNNIIKRINVQLIDRTFGYFLDGIFPISRFLEEKSKRFHKPLMILPVIASYNRVIEIQNSLNYFAFCADAAYLVRNNLILEAFSLVHQKYPLIRFVLVLFGRQEDMDKVKSNIVQLNLSCVVDIKSQIHQSELLRIYDNAIGLLIPLQPNTLQDKARFSQKIAEYVGSKRPIITNEVGEIPYYFEDRESAMFADYSSNGFCDCMCELIKNPDKATEIGKAGFEVGLKSFDYVVNAKRMISFLKNL